MFTLRIEHQIHGYEMWRAAFDRLAAIRERAGARNHRISLAVDDPNFIMIDLDFDSADAAETFLGVLRREVWGSAAAPALAGGVQTRIVEVMESKGY